MRGLPRLFKKSRNMEGSDVERSRWQRFCVWIANDKIDEQPSTRDFMLKTGLVLGTMFLLYLLGLTVAAYADLPVRTDLSHGVVFILAGAGAFGIFLMLSAQGKLMRLESRMRGKP